MSDLLFVYGTLAPADSESAARSGWEPDMVRGRLFDLGNYPALVDHDDPAAEWVAGYVRAVERDGLMMRLDAYEGVNTGPYRRAVTITRAGRQVWVYVHARPLPAHAQGPIERWDGPRVAFSRFEES